jgi:hypothetical protein
VTYSFVVTLDGVDFTDPDSTDADALYEAGCDDAVPEHVGQVRRLVFDRDAASFAAAVASALIAIETALPAASVLRVERIASVGGGQQPLPHSA